MPKPPNNNDIPTVSSPDFPEGGKSAEEYPKIKGYKIIKQLGEGGMGIVYLAEQKEPIKRQVALKVVKPGMDSKQVIARFETEKQALAFLDHPNIAYVYDAGTTKQGRPYFVMEYVEGLPITNYCDLKKLSIEERLSLFIQVCEAVQHAHQKGIIHRDIKPSNILISSQEGKAIPKIIDFGVAKALSQQLTEQTMFTEQGQLIGTPEYMSPEQAEMTNRDIDTRTDVYSLGVLLYELLTGTLPFEPKMLREAGFAEIQRIIKEKDPPRPSARLSTIGEKTNIISDKRCSDPKSLLREVSGDLDWITMKAIEKDVSRRFSTVHELSLDIEKYLTSQPVTARPPSAVYTSIKFIRRNRSTVTFVNLIMALLLFAIAGLIWYGDRAHHSGWKVATGEYEDRVGMMGDAVFVLRYIERERAKRIFGYKAIIDNPPQTVEEFINEPLIGSGIKFLSTLCPIETENEILPAEVLRAINEGEVIQVADSIRQYFPGEFSKGARVLIQMIIDSLDFMDNITEFDETFFSGRLVNKFMNFSRAKSIFDHLPETAWLPDVNGTYYPALKTLSDFNIFDILEGYIDSEGEINKNRIEDLPHTELFVLRYKLNHPLTTFMYGLDFDFWGYTFFAQVLPFAIVGILCILAAAIVRFVL